LASRGRGHRKRGLTGTFAEERRFGARAAGGRGAPQGFIRKWRLKWAAVAGDRLFTFTPIFYSAVS